MENYNTIFYQLNSKKDEIIHKEETLAELESLLFSLQEKIKIKNLSISILEYLKNYKLEYKKDFILSIINSAIKDIFQDEIAIDIEQEVKKTTKNIRYNIVFYQNGYPIAKNEELLETNGGGVLSVISVLFKILIGFFYSKNKFFIFDESFSQVSPQYRERLSLFLRKFSEQYNFTIVIVSQTEDLNTYAHKNYYVNYKYLKSRSKKFPQELKTLYIEKEETDDNLEMDIFYTKIKNFQSIKEIEFTYQGFTVISGPNNCGKSASLRAIKSLIFNDFKEKFLRYDTKEAEIEFGKIINNEIIHKIKLIYKSKKVIYEIDGNQYLGKTLAADIIKEEVQKIGFKYIDIKKLYKNIKGDLRNQTEKIAYSSQYDNMFLIGQKHNDIEKIFNFLFNTENITLSIAELKEEILELNKELKDTDLKINEIKLNINNLEKEIEFLTLKYQVLFLNAFLENLNEIKILNIELNKIETIFENINNKYNTTNTLHGWVKYLKAFLEFNDQYQFILNEINLKQFKLDLLNNLKINESSQLIIDINIIRNYFEHLALYTDIDHKIIDKENKLKILYNLNYSKIDQLQNEINNIKMFLRNLNDIQDNILKEENQINQYKKYLIDLNEWFHQELERNGIELCPVCHGSGYKNKI